MVMSPLFPTSSSEVFLGAAGRWQLDVVQMNSNSHVDESDPQ